MPGLTFQESLVVGIIATVLIGSKLPEIAKTLGLYYGRLLKTMSKMQK